MSEQLSGRALDEACARAMGWSLEACQCGSERWRICNQSYQYSGIHEGELPKFSTDAATIPEMCAWLRERRLRWVVAELGDGLTLAQTFAGIVLHEIDRATGATLNEALARLVVAVAAAKEK